MGKPCQISLIDLFLSSSISIPSTFSRIFDIFSYREFSREQDELIFFSPRKINFSSSAKYTSANVIVSGSRPSDHPPACPFSDFNKPDFLSSPRTRRTTTGFVPAWSAISADVRTRSGLSAIWLKECKASKSLLLRFICGFPFDSKSHVTIFVASIQ